MIRRDATTSIRMAVAMGIFLPLAETVRRSNQLADPQEFLSWFDDYLLGGCLLVAALAARRGRPGSIVWLVAAWGAASGALFLSLLGQVRYLSAPEGDPGVLPAGVVLAAKASILTYMLLGLWKAVRASRANVA